MIDTSGFAKGLLTFLLQHEKGFQAYKKEAREIAKDFALRPEYALLYLRALGEY